MHLLLRIYSIGLLVLGFYISHAQHTSNFGRFSITYEKGCVPVTIHIATSPSFSGFTNSYYYENNLLDVNDTFYTYTDPGIYQIVQLTQETISPKTDTLTFEVIENTAPQFVIYECGSQTVQVDIQDNVYDFYRVYFTSNDSIDFYPGDPFPTFTYPANNVQILVTGFYNNSYPTCGETFNSINLNNTLAAATISNATFTQTCGNIFDLNLSAATSPNIKYQIELSFGGNAYNNIYEGPINNSLAIRDINNPGFLDYCLRITTIEACSNTTITGPSYCNAIPSNQFDYLSDAYASYSGSEVSINFINQSALDVLIRNTSTSTYDTINSSTLRPSSGADAFELIMFDSCQTFLDTIVVAPPRLRITDRDYETNRLILSLTDPLNNLTETSRELVVYSEDSTIVEVISYDDNVDLTSTIGKVQYLRARYWYNEINEPVYSNEVVARYIYRIYVPTAFTPNNDGLNDRLEFFGLSGNSAEISIFNRWGQQIHFTNNLSTGWNGYVNNDIAPEGAYTYEIKFTSPDGEEIFQVGTFALIKK